MFLRNWLQTHADITFQLSAKDIIFSQTKNVLLSYILVLAKYYIYKTKFFSHQVNTQIFITYLKKKFQNEKYISKLYSKQDKFFAKWASLWDSLHFDQ